MAYILLKDMAEAQDDEVMFNQAPEHGQGDGDDNLDDTLDDHDIVGRNGREDGDNGRPKGPYRHFYIKPESYSGNSDWEEYFSHFQDCVELGGLTEQDKVLTLAASLRGPARTFYISLSHAERRNYDLLVTKLQQRFGCTRQQNRWLSRFESRKRLPGESIALLGDDLRQLSQKAYANLDAVAQEALALNQLYKSVSLEMKCRCIDKECTTVSDAIEVIERYEAILGDSQDKKKTPVRQVSNVGTSVENDIREPDYQQLTARIAKLEATSTKPYQQGQQTRNTPIQKFQRTRNCYICDSPDHYFRNCPVYKKCMVEMTNRPSNQNGRPVPYPSEKKQGNYKPSM